MKRSHKRLFKLNDAIRAIDAETRQIEAELEYHRSINDDAQRDAAVGNYIDREEAALTAADVGRFERVLERLQSQRAKLARKRDMLLAKTPL